MSIEEKIDALQLIVSRGFASMSESISLLASNVHQNSLDIKQLSLALERLNKKVDTMDIKFEDKIETLYLYVAGEFEKIEAHSINELRKSSKQA